MTGQEIPYKIYEFYRNNPEETDREANVCMDFLGMLAQKGLGDFFENEVHIEKFRFNAPIQKKGMLEPVPQYEKLYNSTERIIGKKHQLKWCTYQQLENNRYPTADVVIFHFTKEIIERERAFAAIIKIKGSLGHLTPILAISEGGSIQDIFSILKAGAYDYIETIDNTRKYKKKIENLILWNWYIKKHTSAKKRQC